MLTVQRDYSGKWTQRKKCTYLQCGGLANFFDPPQVQSSFWWRSAVNMKKRLGWGFLLVSPEILLVFLDGIGQLDTL